eukprot:4421533-Lingulodinium_polyedra.AAC.1
MPDWAMTMVDALACDRIVQARVVGYTGVERVLRRNIGMGGPPTLCYGTWATTPLRIRLVAPLLPTTSLASTAARTQR